MLGVLFDGIAYGSLLFLVSVGLSVTMGLMNFVNLAHGAFAMAGGYVCVVAMTRLGVPFLAALPLAFLAAAAAGAVLERPLFRPLFGASHLDQVLFSIGLDASFPLKFMVYSLLVVVVGGAGSVRGPLAAALLLGVLDVAGKYYVPQAGAFVIYAAMVVLLIAFPAGLGRRRA